jgi:hypothetical protein
MYETDEQELRAWLAHVAQCWSALQMRLAAEQVEREAARVTERYAGAE